MATSTIAVALSPVPGFCVKSRTTSEGPIHLTASSQPHLVAKGQKIFVNIAWDPNVPPPPPASEDAIRRAVRGPEMEGSNTGTWFVPIVLSDPREDLDKAGQSAIVFDCVLNPSIKSRTIRDPDFKSFIIELALQRIEAQTALLLSRQIGTPNIASKGKLRSQRVLVPAALFPPGHPHEQAPPALVQEITDPPPGVPNTAKSFGPTPEPQLPAWSWTQQGSNIRMVFDVPGVTHSIIPKCTLDVEPRRILLHIPGLYNFDINLDSPDSVLGSVFGRNGTTDAALKLKRVHSFNVDGARAEWRVADKAIVLLA